MLRRGAEEIVGVLDHILVQRSGRGHQNGQRRVLAPSGAARLLPGAGDGAGIAAQHARREGADVDAQLQRIGGHDHVHLARSQAALDFATLGGQIAAAVAAHTAGKAVGGTGAFLEVPGDDLHLNPAFAKHDGGNIISQKPFGDAPDLVDHAAADAQLAVDHGRVVKHEMPLAHGRAVFGDGGDFPPGQLGGQLHGVGDGGAAQDEARVAAIKRAQAHQAAKHVGQMASEYAAVGVQFVDDDVFEIFKQLDPSGMVGEDVGVQHVRVGDHDVARLPDGLARGGLGIAVVGIGFDVHPQGLDHVVEAADLIGRERLGGKEVQGARVVVFQDGGYHGQVVAQGLSAGGGGDHHKVAPLLRQAEALRLMAVQPVDAARAKHIAKARVHIVRQGLIAALRGGQSAPFGHAVHKGAVGPQAADELVKVHGNSSYPGTMGKDDQRLAASSIRSRKPSVISSVPSIKVHMASAPGMDSISARLSS